MDGGLEWIRLLGAKSICHLWCPGVWSVRNLVRKVLTAILVLFLLPLAVHATLHVAGDHPKRFREADWSSTGMLPRASADSEPRLLVFAGRTGRRLGIFSVHCWIVFKREGDTSWSRYDVLGSGPVRLNAWAPDSHWNGGAPRVIIDVRGERAAVLIPKVKDAIESYAYGDYDDYRVWPGPNSNTFVATVLRAVPELAIALPANAVGKDFRSYPYAGLTDSRTGLLGVKVGWIEGVELNFLGLVAGLDIRHPGLKLPGFGRLGVPDGSAIAAPE
jgi:Protein of unknown function (DUF3750)